MKQKLLFLMFAVLGCCMAQATPIPSAYYSAVGAGSFYLYDITAETFLSHSNNFPATASTPDASCLMVVSSNGDGTYAIKYNNAQYLKMGTYNNIYIWADGGSSDTKWIFTTVAGAVNTYIVSTSEYADQFSTKTWYLISGNATDVEANAHQYALITAANYAEYVARQAAEAAFSKAVSQANTIKEQTSAYTDPGTAVETLEGAVSAAQTAVASAADAAAVNTQAAAVLAAVKTFIGAVNINSGQHLDLTCLIANASFDEGRDGWTSNPAINNVSHGVAEFFGQYAFDINQVLTDMPRGNYELTVEAFQWVSMGTNDEDYAYYKSGNYPVTANIYINGGATTIKNVMEASSPTAYGTVGVDDFKDEDGGHHPKNMATSARYFADEIYKNTVQAQVEGDLTFGFRGPAASHNNWTIFDDFRLYYYGTSAVDITLDEGSATFSVLSDYDAANVTLERTFNEGWNGIVLPFTTTVDNLKTKLGATEVKTFSSIAYDAESGTVTLNFADASDELLAGVPCIVKIAAGSTTCSATFEAVPLKTDITEQVVTTAENARISYAFTGTYNKVTKSDMNLYFLSGDKLNHVSTEQSITMKPYRAWFENRSTEEVEVKVALNLDDMATGVQSVCAEPVVAGDVYDLSGRSYGATTSSSKLPKGIYIRGGKKIVVK
ncbi:MAG: hypothetical protein IJ767_03755 [Bacteroidaceae bacterium]|nr:hypothetical protein [Bacteroidaceae bacterium]